MAAASTGAAASHPFAESKTVKIINAEGVVDCTAPDASSMEVTVRGAASATTDRCVWTVDASGPVPEFFLQGADVSCRMETVANLSDQELSPEVHLYLVTSRGLADARIERAAKPILDGKQFRYLEIAGRLPGDASGEHAFARWSLTRGQATVFFHCVGPIQEVAKHSAVLEAAASTVAIEQ